MPFLKVKKKVLSILIWLAVLCDIEHDHRLTISITLCYLYCLHMDTEIFVIKSLNIQNAIMLTSLAAVVSLLVYSMVKRRPKHVMVFTVWVFLVLWFFNSPFFGFSTVSVSLEGIRLQYGILSWRNVLLPPDSAWTVDTYLSGIRKNKRLHFISIAGRQSMKVKGEEKLQLLKRIGESIDRMKAGKTGVKNEQG